MAAPDLVNRTGPAQAARLAWTFFRISALNELQYRVNFFLQLFQSLIALGTALAVLALVFSHTQDLAGWSAAQLLAVMAVHIIMGGVIKSAIQPNMLRLIEDVREGTLDHALTKPEDAQLVVSIREFRIWPAVDVVVGLILLRVAISQFETSVGVGAVLVFVVVLGVGSVLIYCFWLILAAGAFWIVRMEFMVELFDGLYQAGRWPVGIYPVWLRAGLTFLVPLAFAITVPAEGIAGRLNTATLVWVFVFAAVLVTFTRWFWRSSLKRYSGASA